MLVCLFDKQDCYLKNYDLVLDNVFSSFIYKTSPDVGFLSTIFMPSQAVRTSIILYLGLCFMI